MRRSANAFIRGSDPNRVLSNEDADQVVGIAPHKAVYSCQKCGNDVVVPLHPEATVPPSWNCPCGGVAEYVGDKEIGEELKSFSPPLGSRVAKTPLDHLMERRSEEELEAVLAKRLEDLRNGRLHREREL